MRFITRDDVRQADAVDRLLTDSQEKGEALYLSDHILCEVVWVLETAFGLPKDKLLLQLERLIYSSEVAFSTSSKAANALAAYQEGSGDFADYLIRKEALEAGCRAVATFDKKLLNEPGFIEP